MQAAPIPLVATTRGYPSAGYTIENVHAGSVAVVDASGRLVAWAGDPHYQTFTRSALKPFQALPFLLSDGPNKFGLAQEELALLCASHSGEEKHLRGVEAILDKRVVKGPTKYLVRWKGWPEEYNQWEPAENLEGAPDLLSEFHASVARPRRKRRKDVER